MTTRTVRGSGGLLVAALLLGVEDPELAGPPHAVSARAPVTASRARVGRTRLISLPSLALPRSGLRVGGGNRPLSPTFPRAPQVLTSIGGR